LLSAAKIAESAEKLISQYYRVKQKKAGGIFFAGLIQHTRHNLPNYDFYAFITRLRPKDTDFLQLFFKNLFYRAWSDRCISKHHIKLFC
jgi:hypothetical protein